MICFLGLACLVTMGSTAQIAVAGSIVAWGNDDYGQVSGTPTGTGFTAIASGGFHGYALRADGSIAAWGSDFFGEVSNTPTGTGFTAIAAGGSFGYALRADGAIAGWGNDGDGQVSSTPTGTGFTAIAGGFSHGYALRAEQTPAVPEPSTVVLTGLGAIAVIWRQSRRRTA
ncbi:MAG: PEP-CTERM sorting domain-containing protein [Planctomycetaceae bacterium]